MAGGRGRGSSKLVASGDEEDEFLYPSEVLESLWAPGSSSSFQGSKAMVNFESECGGEGTSKTFFHTVDKEESGEVEDYGGISFPLSGKKRRLTAGQVEFLERNFEVENKLEPERKVQLAKELGLQPRQVAIWFQNRRARFKTKQLEKDYDSLKACYDSLRDNYDSLFKEKEKLKLEVHSLRDKLLMRDEEKENTTSPEHLASLHIHRHECSFPKELPEILPDASSAKSDVLDSDSPNFPEPANSSHGFELENSDERDESSLHKSLLAPLLHLPKLEDGYHHDQPEDYACTFGLSCEEDQPFWRWPY